MPTRPAVLGAAALAVLGAAVALFPAHAQQIHRHGFAGKQTALVRGDANVRVEEQEHDISTQYFKSQPSSEHLKLTAELNTGDAPFVHYFYETPPAPVTELLSAGVWVKASKAGVQFRARVVFPKEPDPARPEAPLTMLIVGKTYDKALGWQKLTLENVPDLVGKHLVVLQAKIGRAVNPADAYIDRLVLNLYTGPGPLDVWVDDLDIGPVKGDPRPDTAGPGGAPGTPAKQPRPGDPAGATGKSRAVEQRGGQLLVDGKPRFFRAIRHTGTPLFALQQAGFNSVWFPADVQPEILDEANREGWYVIPSAPVLTGGPVSTNREADAFAGFLRKFGTSDVLFWDLGGGLTEEQVNRVDLTAKVIREGDRKRPLGGDLWDGFQSYSQYLDVVGAHRWPLFTSLELVRYRDWLAQRRSLVAGGRCLFWTWVQNHLPDWYVSSVLGQPNPDAFTDPIGPHPEQVRLLAYLSVASGCRGLGFWSDRFLADSHHGRDRLQGMALLNAELDMLSPVLLAAGDRVEWRDTTHPNVKAALLRSPKGLLVLPIWLGPGCQYVPDQGAVNGLRVTVPMVPDGAEPWLIGPAGVECLRHKCTKLPGGTELTLDEFDLVAPVVFTADHELVVWWQDYVRRYRKVAAKWSLDLTAVEYEKVRVTHEKLVEQGADVRGADTLLRDAQRYYRDAQKHYANDLFDKAHLDATRALRPLRILMRDHWKLATDTLDVPTASPFAVSFFSLPRHWELFREVQASRVGANVLPHGGFEPPGDLPAAGMRIDGLPGWSARYGALEVDRVVVAAGVVPPEKLADTREPRKAPVQPKTLFSPSRTITPADEGYTPPAPELGKGVLKLEVRSQVIKDKDGKPLPINPVLERTFLAVDSPPVRLPPGTLVRVSGWVKVPTEIVGTADGVLMYDDAGGEPLAVRVLSTREKGDQPGVWKKYHLYRRVPSTGQISVTLAVTGHGVAYFDDIRIEPLVPTTTTSNRK